MIKNQCFYFLPSSTRKLVHQLLYHIQNCYCLSKLPTELKFQVVLLPYVHTLNVHIFLAPKVAVAREESFAEKLLSVPELASLPGPLFRSSEAIQLTESETEYVVKCIKHSFPHHLVLQVLYLSHLVIVLTN